MIPMPVLLIADDNRQILSVIKEYAENEGHEVKAAYDGDEALSLFQAGGIDLILLDVMMPKKDGFAVCREIRKSSNVPIIMVTARGEDFERIMGLDIGADDYIVKPFSPGEIMARVRAVLRRVSPREASGTQTEVLRFGNLSVDMERFTAEVDDSPVSLTKKEMEPLWTMVQSPGRVYSRDQLLDLIWGYDYYGDNRTVDSHIKRLRAKLDTYEHPQWDIYTIWGVGYKFEVKADEK